MLCCVAQKEFGGYADPIDIGKIMIALAGSGHDVVPCPPGIPWRPRMCLFCEHSQGASAAAPPREGEGRMSGAAPPREGKGRR